MEKGLVNIDWSKTFDYSDEDVTYYLYLEGKSVEAITQIRSYSKEKVNQHILQGKIKYGVLAKSRNEKELFERLKQAGKQDKINILDSIDSLNKKKILDYIKVNYVNMNLKDKEVAVWIIGECKDKGYTDMLIKASVNRNVSVRRMAVSAMGKIEDKKAEIAINRALEDENPQVVLYALKALQKVKCNFDYDKVFKIYENTEKEYLKRASGELLKGVGFSE